MDWITEHWTILIGPAVVAAVISSIVTVIGFFITTRAAKAMHREKLAFDQKLAERKFCFCGCQEPDRNSPDSIRATASTTPRRAASVT